MYLSDINLRQAEADSPEVWRSLGDGYFEHRLLWNLFSDGPERKRDFLYRRLEAGRILAVSERRPTREHRWVRTLDYDPQLRAGQRLAFSLRVNPVVSRRDNDKRQHRHDVVMEEKKARGWKNIPDEKRPPLAELVREAGLAWLASRALQAGFSALPEAVMVEGYVQHRLDSPRKGRRQAQFSSLDFSGLLTVEDPGLFRQTLFTGLGPAKAYGCGLLLVKPAREG